MFIGRSTELAFLGDQLQAIQAAGRGALLSVRGRRQVGKSRLLEEFLEASDVPSVFYTASRQSADRELEAFRDAVARSDLEAAELARAGPLGSWEAALTLVAGEASRERPVVIVLDELPYLVGSEPTIEGVLQKLWDRTLERRPVLLILVGSDLSMMASLTEHGRPLYGRPRELVVEPLSPFEIGELTGLDPGPAFDAYMVIGGFPRLALLWRRGRGMWDTLEPELADSSSPLLVLGERSLAAEFPTEIQAREVLLAVGAGKRAYAAIANRAGIEGSSLDRALETLQRKRIVERSLPYSARRSLKAPRYTVADPYLRFWLRFLAGAPDLIDRGRADVVLDRIRGGWEDYRGRAVEPLVRDSIERLLPDGRLGRARFVGSYWTRDNRIEVDLVGGRQPAEAETVEFVGSVKWRERAKFGRDDARVLSRAAADVPGASAKTPLVGVSRGGFSDDSVDVRIDAEDLLRAWSP